MKKFVLLSIATLIFTALAVPGGITLAKQAAPLKPTTYHRTLPAPTLRNEIPTDILIASFTSHRGVLSLRTFQQANLFTTISSRPSICCSSHVLTVTVLLDGSAIYTTRKFDTQSPYELVNGQLVYRQVTPDDIGIFTTHYLTSGRHTLTLSYIFEYGGRGTQCQVIGSQCGNILHPGRSTIITP